jgi:RND family efflux transporter MFP subunit
MEKIKTIFKKPLNIILMVAIIFAGAGIYMYKASNKESSYEFIEVKKGEITQLVSVTGKVKPADSVDLAFEKSGKVASISVKVGDRILAGQQLASLSNADLAAQLAQAQASLDKEKVKLAELKAGTRPEELQIAQTTVENAEKTLTDAIANLANVKSKATIDLNNYYNDVKDILNDAYIDADDAVNKQVDELFVGDNTSNPQLVFYTSSQAKSNAEYKRWRAGQELTLFKSDLDNLAQDQTSLDTAMVTAKSRLAVVLDFLTSLSDAVNDASNVSSTTLANYKYYVNTARTNVNTAITSISTQEQYIATQKATNQSNISTAEASVNTAKNSLAKAQDELKLKQAGSTVEEIAAQEAQIKYAQANVQNYQASLTKTIIYSPINGVVTKKEAEVGEIVAANATVISVLSVAQFEVEANVSENEIAKVSLNDKIEMTLDALGPTEKFSGRVVEIDPAETIVSGVIYYKATSVFDVEDARIKSGMTVNLDIQTDKKEDVLYLPYYVVKERNGDRYVQVLENGKLKEKIIKTGLEGETMIEIIEGLAEGEKVVVAK